MAASPDPLTPADRRSQEQARALGDPTRHGIYRAVQRSEDALSVGDLAAQFGLNHNAVRQHLRKLVDAGLVVGEAGESQGRGRPPARYRPAADPVAHWAIATPYERLTVLLLEVARSGDPYDVGIAAGRRLVADEQPGGDAVDSLAGIMARQGFEPFREDTEAGTDLVLQRCPYEAAALADRSIVCAIHRGLAQGVVEATGGEVTDLVVEDPRKAGCRLRLRVQGRGQD